ncbi:hypothetical protein HDU99_002075, partial [Rhizoclosmatium hyalinum]
AGLHSLPPELLPDILVLLPIDDKLVDVGLTCKLLSQFIFANYRFAQMHFQHQYAIYHLSRVRSDLCIMDYLQQHITWLWRHLPFNYQTVVFGEALQGKYSRKLRRICDGRIWTFPPTMAVKAVQQLLDFGFDPSVQSGRIIQWAAAKNWVE